MCECMCGVLASLASRMGRRGTVRGADGARVRRAQNRRDGNCQRDREMFISPSATGKFQFWNTGVLEQFFV